MPYTVTRALRMRFNPENEIQSDSGQNVIFNGQNKNSTSLTQDKNKLKYLIIHYLIQDGIFVGVII